LRTRLRPARRQAGLLDHCVFCEKKITPFLLPAILLLLFIKKGVNEKNRDKKTINPG
jgi:hypothetical protein